MSWPGWGGDAGTGVSTACGQGVQVLPRWLWQLPDSSFRRRSEAWLHFIPIPAVSHLCRRPKERCHIHFSPSYTSLLDLYISPLAVCSPCPRSATSGFHLAEGHPFAPRPWFWVSPCYPSPASPDVPSQGCGMAGSCLHRGGLFRQLELWPAATILGRGVLWAVASQRGQCQLYFWETLTFQECPGLGDAQDGVRRCRAPVCCLGAVPP